MRADLALILFVLTLAGGIALLAFFFIRNQCVAKSADS